MSDFRRCQNYPALQNTSLFPDLTEPTPTQSCKISNEYDYTPQLFDHTPDLTNHTPNETNFTPNLSDHTPNRPENMQ